MLLCFGCPFAPRESHSSCAQGKKLEQNAVRASVTHRAEPTGCMLLMDMLHTYLCHRECPAALPSA